MNYTMRYRKDGVYLVQIFLHVLLMIIGVVPIAFLLVSGVSLVNMLFLFPLTVISGLNARYYVDVNAGKRWYLRIEGDCIQKDRGMILPRETMRIADVIHVMVVGDVMRLSSGNRKEIAISLRYLMLEDIKLLEELFMDKMGI